MAQRNSDTSVLVDDDDDHEEFGRDSVTDLDDGDSNVDYITQVRNYNKLGPHVIHPQQKPKEIKSPRRLIKKTGKYNVLRKTERANQLWEKYLRDLSTTLVASKWRWTVLTASSSFILSWIIFAMVWMLISNANGDLDFENPTPHPCMVGPKSFGGYFMFSLETQTTIGYGSRYISDNCPEGVFVLCLQIIMGVAICSLTVNIVYIKMIKPTTSFNHKLISKHAIICRRDGHLCLIFRVRDEDNKHAIGTTITAYMLMEDLTTNEPYLETLQLEPHGFLIWPLEIVHKITVTSPLWDVSSYNLISNKFEIIVTVQGTSATTGQCSRTRTSYTSSEILWGHRFKSCIKYIRKAKSYIVQQKNFNQTYEYATHLCSARRFNDVYNTMSPTPSSSKNYNVKFNVTYDGTQRRGTLMSIESAGSLDKITEINAEDEATPTKEECPVLERIEPAPVQNSGKIDSLVELKNTDLPQPLLNNWEYQSRFPISNLDDSWLKESKSLPVITSENCQYSSLNETNNKNSNSYADYLTRSKRSHLPDGSSNISMFRNFPNRIFEEEEYLYGTHSSFGESLMSIEYPKSEIEGEMEVDVDTMISGLEDYLERNSLTGSLKMSQFPKPI